MSASQLIALRLYFPLSARGKATRFWHRFSAPALGHYLLERARRADIHQAVMHGVQAGYLPGGRLLHAQLEGAPQGMPQCLELIDTEGHLRKFLRDHAEELSQARAVLYRIEMPLAG